LPGPAPTNRNNADMVEITARAGRLSPQHPKKGTMKTKRLTNKKHARVSVNCGFTPAGHARLKQQGAALGLLPGPLAKRLVLEGLDVTEKSGGLTPAQVMQVAT